MSYADWSVRLAVDAAESGPISANENVLRAFHAGARNIAISGSTGPYDQGSDAITLELAAANAADARIRAQHLLGELQRAAGVPVRAARVVWVAPVEEGEASSHRLLARARELMENEEFGLAVVAAQIHLETQVRLLIQRATESDPSPLSNVLLDNRMSWAPHDRLVSSIIEAVFGRRVTEYARWQEYKDVHLRRRNDVAHRGQTIDEASASASINLVEDFWLWLNGLSQDAT